MTTKEIAEVCGVTSECIRQNAKKVGILLENGKIHDYTEEELKKIQIQLMENNVSSGGQKTEGSVVKENLQSALEVGLVAKACLDSPEAWEQFKRLGDSLVEQRLQAKELEARNTQLQAIVDRYVNWKSAKEIKLEYKLPTRPGIEKVAMLLNLKENEDWIARFYDDTHLYKKILYSPEAVGRIVAYIREGEEE